jgi:hypothetical protein
MLFNALAAFGAGALASCIGAVPAFVMTGLITIVGAIAGMAGFDTIAFGTVFGPHIAFAGAVAATAYAAKKGYIEAGAAVGTPLAPLGKPDVLVVGGLFGIIGWVIGTFAVPAVFGGLIPFGTDAPGMTVVISGIIARLVFGKRGLASGTKGAVTSAQSMLIAVAFSLMVGGTGLALNAVNPEIMGSYNLIIFGIAAFTLIFPGTPGWHQIGIISAYAVMIALGAGMTGFAVVAFAVVAGVASNFLCDLEGYLINTDVDSHIDGPGFAICLMTIVLNVVASVL